VKHGSNIGGSTDSIDRQKKGQAEDCFRALNCKVLSIVDDEAGEVEEPGDQSFVQLF
jgi:hypothetical protein